MNDKVKKLLEMMSADRDFAEKACKAETIEEVIGMAKGKGLELTDEDVREATNAAGTVDSDEMKAVTGGDNCVCVAGGGGTKVDGVHGTCACVAYGCGEDLRQGEVPLYCQCYLVGTGF